MELDPASVPEIVDALERERQRVGVVPPHPTFATQPSLRDCENQSNYQRLFALSDSEEKTRVPFVGAIVGPYRGADPVAEMTWFHVDADAGDTWLLRDAGLRGAACPGRCASIRLSIGRWPDGGDVFERLRGDAFALAEVFGRGAERFDRVDLDKPWGSIDVRVHVQWRRARDSAEQDASQPEVPGSRRGDGGGDGGVYRRRSRNARDARGVARRRHHPFRPHSFFFPPF